MKKPTVGICGYGYYVPKHYILSRDIDVRADGLGLVKKSLASWDEDSVTMGVEAAQMALEHSQIPATQVGALYIGSESPAYAVNPSSTIVADILGIGNEYMAVDLQFACKAATAGLQMMAAQIATNGVRYGLVIGADKSQAKKGDALEWSAGAAGAALLIGKEKLLAEVVATASFSSDTPDFWRRESQTHPSHGGRFTGEMAYFRHVEEATGRVLEKSKLSPSDFTRAVFHMPNGKFPEMVAKKLGFSQDQIQDGLTVKELGNPYSASSLMGLVAVLEKSKPNDLVLMTSYGSGAGSDSFVFRVTEKITSHDRGTFEKTLSNRKRITVEEYAELGRWQ